MPRKKTPKCLPSLMTCGQVVSAVHGSVKSLVVVEAEESDDAFGGMGPSGSREKPGKRKLFLSAEEQYDL